MLCQPLDDRNLERNLKAYPTLMAQPKLDGIRCWVQWEDGEPLLWSSEGNLITGVPHISLLLKEWAAKVGPLQFDGELYTHRMKFEDIVGIAKRHSDNLRDDFTNLGYHIFDIKEGGAYHSRYAHLVDAFKDMPISIAEQEVFHLVRCRKCNKENLDDLLTHYVESGYEGIILRNPLGEYVEKRVWTILKWKPSKHDTYEIVQCYEAVSEDGSPLGRLGSILCVDRFGNQFSVGPGLGIDHYKAKELWRDYQRGELDNKHARVYYQNLTERGVPRFGKFSLVISPSDLSDEEHPI